MLEGLLKSKPVTGEKGLPVPRDGLAMDSNIARGRATHPRKMHGVVPDPVCLNLDEAGLSMVDIGFPELLTLVQTVAIILAIVIAVYFSRRQIQALNTDTEARVMNDLDEKLHRIGEIFMEKPEFVRILNDDAAVSNFGAEVAFAFYVMFFCSHCYHMRQRGILSDNDWAGWLQWTKNAFRSGRLGKYWKEAEMQAWVDPAFREFVNREILVGT